MTIHEPPLPDDQLLARYVRHRDAAAFHALVDRHIHWIHGTALRLTRNAALAEDVTQGVLLALSQKAPFLLRHQSLAAWLFRATRYGAAALLRSERRRQKYERAAMPMIREPREDPQWFEIEGALDDAVSRLASKDQQAILLRFYEQLSYTAMAGALAISEEAARKRVDRALERLRSRLHMHCSAGQLGAVLGPSLALARPTIATPPTPSTRVLATAKAIHSTMAAAIFAVPAAILGTLTITLAVTAAALHLHSHPVSPPAAISNSTLIAAPSAPAPSSTPPLLALPQLLQWRAPSKYVAGVALSPDGHLALSASATARSNLPAGIDAAAALILWNTATGEEVRALEGHTRAIGCVAFAPDGKTAASGSRDGTVRLWDVQTGAETARFTVPFVWFKSLVFSADGQQLLAGGCSGADDPAHTYEITLFLWDVHTHKSLVTFPKDRYPLINVVALSPNGRLAAIGNNGREANVLDLSTGKEIFTIHDGGDINALAFSPDSSKLATGGEAEVVCVWDLAHSVPNTDKNEEFPSPAQLACMEGHDAPITALAFLPDGHRILSAGGDDNATKRGAGEVRLWNIDSHRQEACARNFRSIINALAIDAAGNRALAGASDGTLATFQLDKLDPLVAADQPHKVLVPEFCHFPSKTLGINSLEFSADGKRLLSLEDNNGIRVWNVADTTDLYSYDFGGCFATNFITPDKILILRGAQIAVADIHQSGPPSYTNVLKSEEHRDVISSSNLPVFNHGHTCLLLGNQIVLLWDLDTNHARTRIDTPSRINFAVVSPDEQEILTQQGDDVLRAYTLAGALLHEFKAPGISSGPILLAPDGRSFFRTDNWGEDIVQCSLDTGEVFHRFKGHKQQLYALNITPDGKRLISSAFDKTIRVWDVSTGEQIAQYDSPRLCVAAVAIAPDNRTVATDNPDGSISLWKLPDPSP